jgi:hypothetical protein
MFPLTQKFLDLHEIAKHWARDLPQRPSVGEAFQMLLNAFWKGDLWELESGARTEHERFLRILADSQPHPGILVYNNPENLPRVSRPMPDGGVVVDIRNRIYLPRDHAMWTPEVISNALAVLTECKMEDYSEAFALAINGAAVSKEDFAAFCDARGYPRPAFWFGTVGVHRIFISLFGFVFCVRVALDSRRSRLKSICRDCKS